MPRTLLRWQREDQEVHLTERWIACGHYWVNHIAASVPLGWPMVYPSISKMRHGAIAFALFTGTAVAAPERRPQFGRGEVVRLSRSEMLMFKGQDFTGGAKGQEFTILKSEPGEAVVYVSFYKQDGTLIAVTLPAIALEPLPPSGWNDLVRALEAFAEQRYVETRSLLARAAEDSEYRSLAHVAATRVNGAVTAMTILRSVDAARSSAARQACVQTMQALRDWAEHLVQQGYFTLAHYLEEGTDRLSAQAFGSETVAPVSKVNREDLTNRTTIVTRSIARYRQAVALHRLVEATHFVEEGQKGDLSRPELKAADTRLQKEISEADGHHQNADKMRQHGAKGVIHALTALEMGLKLCADHPKLLALKKEMQSAFEERTAPPITEAFLRAAGPEVSAKAMEEGRKLYTSRCTECHDLELLDSRSVAAWRDAVGSMARRAKIDVAQQSRIVAYLAAAQRGLDSSP
jgi:hypothetical protein